MKWDIQLTIDQVTDLVGALDWALSEGKHWEPCSDVECDGPGGGHPSGMCAEHDRRMGAWFGLRELLARRVDEEAVEGAICAAIDMGWFSDDGGFGERRRVEMGLLLDAAREGYATHKTTQHG